MDPERGAAHTLDGDDPLPVGMRDQERERVGRRNVVTLGVTASSLNASVLAWAPVVPLLLRQHGASAGDVVATYAVWNLLAALCQFVGGRLADRIGARPVIIVPTALAGSLWILMGVLTKVGPWLGMALAFIAVQGVFGIQNTSFVTFVADSAPLEGRARAFTRFQWPVAVGYVVGPLVGALIVLPYVSPPVFMIGTGLLYVAVSLLRQRLLRPPPYEVLAVPTASLRTSLSPSVLLRDAVRGSFAQADRRRLLYLTVGVTTLFALTVSGPFLALVGHVQDGLRPRTVEMLFAIGPLGSVALGYASLPWIQRFGAMRVLAVSGGALGLAALGLIVHQTFIGLCLVFLIVFASFQVVNVAFGTVRSSLAEGTESGISIGSTSAFAGVAAFLVLAVVSSVPSHDSARIALSLAALVSLLTGLVAIEPSLRGRGGASRGGRTGPAPRREPAERAASVPLS